MSEKNVQFACALNCMDGRSIAAVDAWMKEKYGVHFVDQPTKEGIVKTLAEDAPEDEIERIKHRVGISVNKHGARVIAIVGHEDCAGNPVTLDEQVEHVKKGIVLVASWGFGVPIVGLFVGIQGHEWRIKTVAE